MYKLLRKIEQYEDIVIFGKGIMGRRLYQELSDEELGKNIIFTDNSAADTMRPMEAFEKFPHALFIVGSTVNQNSMLLDLKRIGVPMQNVWEKVPEKIIKGDGGISERMMQMLLKTVPQTRLKKIDYHLTEHCNLNCIGCAHFSNIAEPYSVSLEEFKRDIKRLGEALNHKLGILVLLGGEPLLHSGIEEFFIFGREVFPESFIDLVTNGTLLMKMPDRFWECCADNHIRINISRYPIEIDEQGIRQKAEKFGCELMFTDMHVIGHFHKNALDLDGNCDPRESFLRCGQACECMILKHGRIYPCATIPGMEHFNRRFGTDLTVEDDDSLDIYKVTDAKEIFDFLSRPVPFCRHCKTYSHDLVEWEVSKKEISEWLTDD